MNRFKINKLLFYLPAILVLGCTKVSNEPFYDLAPRIELVGVENDMVVQFTDSIFVTILYEDGDGDLGNTDPDLNSIFVKDSRLENADEYYLGPLAPAGETISINGTLKLKLSPTFLLGNGTTEKMVLTIFVKDRAGNQSNSIETPPITILED
jgi:hypothetical protein